MRPEGPEPLDEGELRVRAGERAFLAGRWQSQARDARWSGDTLRKVQDLLNTAKLDVNAVSDVDCRGTICRFELTATGGAEALGVVRVARATHEETWVDHHAGNDGSYKVDVFMAGDGYRLSGDGGRIDKGPAPMHE